MKYLHNSVKSRRSIIKIALYAFGVILVGAGIAWFGVDRWYQSNLRPLTTASHEIFFVVEPGTSTISIANQLEEKEIIKNSQAFIWYIERMEQDATIQAGAYRLNSALSVSEIADMLINGKIDSSLFTIPPGLRIDQIKDVFVRAGYSAKEVEEALLGNYNSDIMKYKPVKASLEGYIFPETLQVNAESTPKSIIERSLKIFDGQLNDTLLEGIKKQKLSVHQAIILASIIQEEVSDPEEQRKVAQVYLKRLAEDMPLQADPTFRYAAKVFGGPESSDNNSTYNTYKHKGLPPGPIANFNISALSAVANPADSDYLYFVSGDDGITRFSKTLQEHEKNIEKYCQELCKL